MAPLKEDDILPFLDLWPGISGARATLINLSENHTFRIDCANGRQYALRVHRQGYQCRASIVSELTWVSALGEQTVVPVPQPVEGTNGNFVQSFGGADAVLFDYMPGSEPSNAEDFPWIFEELGRLAAHCHLHAMSWQPPERFSRPRWTMSAMLGTDGLWGDWRHAPGLDDPGRQVLEQVASVLESQFGGYGYDPHRFGLIHADMRLANLLMHKGELRLIDFDDCGFCWFVYDFAAAVSFSEDDPVVPELWERWLTGYGRVRALQSQDIAMRDAAVMSRRMLLLAWIGSHSETELAQSQAPHFAKGTLALAERFLSGRSLWG